MTAVLVRLALLCAIWGLQKRMMLMLSVDRAKRHQDAVGAADERLRVQH
jgi:hypothetical protein